MYALIRIFGKYLLSSQGLSLDATRMRLMGRTGWVQDPIEARSNVEKRLEFISTELVRLDAQLKAHQDKQNRREQQARILQPP